MGRVQACRCRRFDEDRGSPSGPDRAVARGAAKAVRRRLRPYGLVLKSGIWYLVTAAESRTGTYRGTQVLDAMLSETSRPPSSSAVSRGAAPRRVRPHGLSTPADSTSLRRPGGGQRQARSASPNGWKRSAAPHAGNRSGERAVK
ncbi:WYL domain-containing protein [Streptomyces decoyicus]